MNAQQGYRGGALWRAYDRAAAWLDRRFGWPALPRLLGLATLIGIRNVLRRENLVDTTALPHTAPEPLGPWQESYRRARTADGSYNDLEQPEMGRRGSRFGRNVRIQDVTRDDARDVLEPNPRLVSTELLTRDEFKPVTTLNALAAAWLQFMVKDWFSHGPGDGREPWRVPVPAGEEDAAHGAELTIPRTLADPTRPRGLAEADGAPTFINHETPWWDGSQLYGTTAQEQRMRREGTSGRLRVSGDRLAFPEDPALDPRMVPGFWLGLSFFSRIFALEHNAVAEHLHQANPEWGDEELFQRARLVISALLAKIHTVEWTPAVIAHPTTVTAMHANWYGLAGERLGRLLARVHHDEVLSGIPGAKTDHFGVPYSLTEEFVAVYRMHQLVTDDWTFRSRGSHAVLAERPFRELTGRQVDALEGEISLADLAYSFGHTHPGQIVLRNFPRDLQTFTRPDGRVIDLAAIDILRTREAGVPRYNAFRRAMHLHPAASFETLTENPDWAARMRRVYRDVEDVDLSVGLYAEPLPEGFAFSDTAFRIFILMASRRLNSDRFFTTDFTEDVYTPQGMRWLREATLADVLRRHCPGLGAALAGLPHAFAPFHTAGSRS